MKVSGLRPADNPFRSNCIDGLSYVMDAAAWEALCARLAGWGHRGALIGHHGAGKSTLLRRIEAHYAATGWPVVRCSLNRERRRHASAYLAEALAQCDSRTVLLLDGAEQIGPYRWWWLKRRARRLGGLIITAHRAGRLPTVYRCETSPALVRQLVGTLKPDADHRVDALAQDAWRRHGGNMRGVFFELYDALAAQASTAPPRE